MGVNQISEPSSPTCTRLCCVSLSCSPCPMAALIPSPSYFHLPLLQRQQQPPQQPPPPQQLLQQLQQQLLQQLQRNQAEGREVLLMRSWRLFARSSSPSSRLAQDRKLTPHLSARRAC